MTDSENFFYVFTFLFIDLSSNILKKMKTKSIIVIFVVVLSIVSCKKKHEVTELPRIEYDVLLNNQGNNYSWFDHIEGFQRIEFFQTILNNVRSGNFRTEDMEGNLLDVEHIDSILSLIVTEDSLETQITLNAENLNGIRFREKWFVNTHTGMIEKEVLAFCPVYFHQHPATDDSPFSKAYPLFWIYPMSSESKPDQMIITPKIAFDVITDNTLFMVKHSYGDQLPFYFMNIEPSLKTKINNAILDAGFEKRTPVYDYFFMELKDDQMAQLQERHDTISIFKNDDSLLPVDSVFVYTLDRQTIHKLKFTEEWTLDKNTMLFSKNVIAVSPSVISYDDGGEFKGFRFLFWLLFDAKKKDELVFY
jgi:hypothetical protein